MVHDRISREESSTSIVQFGEGTTFAAPMFGAVQRFQALGFESMPSGVEARSTHPIAMFAALVGHRQVCRKAHEDRQQPRVQIEFGDESGYNVEKRKTGSGLSSQKTGK
jgi:hypothetical protein